MVAALAGPNIYTLTRPRRVKCGPTVNVERLSRQPEVTDSMRSPNGALRPSMPGGRPAEAFPRESAPGPRLCPQGPPRRSQPPL